MVSLKSRIILGFCFLPFSLIAAGPEGSFFVANEGQWEAPFGFQYEGSGGIWYITAEGMTIDLRRPESTMHARGADERRLDGEKREPVRVRGHVIKMTYVGANAEPELVGEDKLPHYSNYFLSRDSCRWRSFVGHYRKVVARDVWPGVDIEYRIEPEGVETVYHVAAGVSPSVIQVRCEGLDAPLWVDSEGNLVLRTSLGELKEKAPYAYQVVDRRRVEVAVRYRIVGDDGYVLLCSGLLPGYRFTIDPLMYGTFLGGFSQDIIYGLTQDGNGNKIVCGSTGSPDFPVTPGAYDTTAGPRSDAFVSKFSSDGRALLFSTYIGGDGMNTASEVIADSEGSIYISGTIEGGTWWPVTADAFDTVCAGTYESFLSRLSSSGSTLEFSSCLGGEGNDIAYAMVMDAIGRAFVGGFTWSPDFYLTPDALYSGTDAGGFVSVFDPATSSLIYSTRVQGSTEVQRLVLLEASPMRMWITGRSRLAGLPVTPDALQTEHMNEDNRYFALLDLAVGQVEYCSYFGWHGVGGISCLIPTGASRLLIAGITAAPDFAVTPDAFDTTYTGRYKAFVMDLDLPNTILHSTLFGSRVPDDGWNNTLQGVFPAVSGGIGIVGTTQSDHYPVTPDAFDSTFGGVQDLFLARLSSDLTQLEYGSYLGGTTWDILCDVVSDSPSSVWLAGETESFDFPYTPDAYQGPGTSLLYGDGFMVHFDFGDSAGSSRPRIEPLPAEFSVSCYPNPFNSQAVIRYTLPRQAGAELEVFDILGRLVSRADLGMITAGNHARRLDFASHASGTYLIRLRTADHMATTKILCVR